MSQPQPAAPPPAYPTVLVEITMPDGTIWHRRCVGLSVASAEYPQAIQLRIVPPEGNFW